MSPESSTLEAGRISRAPGVSFVRLLREGLVPILLLAEIVFFSLTTSSFLSVDNLSNVIVNASDVGLLAAGVTIVVLVGGIDVSVGNMVGVVAWVAVSLAAGGMPIPVVLLASVVLGAVLGTVNGSLVAFGKVPAIIATLGMAAIYRTVLFVLWDKTDIFTGPIVPALGPLARVGPVPTVALLMLAVFGVLAWVLRYTVFGWCSPAAARPAAWIATASATWATAPSWASRPRCWWC